MEAEIRTKAKQEAVFRFYPLYGRIHRLNVLMAASARVRLNDGVPGLVGVTFERIERQGGVSVRVDPKGEWEALANGHTGDTCRAFAACALLESLPPEIRTSEPRS